MVEGSSLPLDLLLDIFGVLLFLVLRGESEEESLSGNALYYISWKLAFFFSCFVHLSHVVFVLGTASYKLWTFSLRGRE